LKTFDCLKISEILDFSKIFKILDFIKIFEILDLRRTDNGHSNIHEFREKKAKFTLVHLH